MPMASDQPHEVLVSDAAIATRISEIADQMRTRLTNETVVVGLLQGGFIFMADLMRGLAASGVYPSTDFLWLSSYGDERESGRMNVVADLQKPVTGRQVVLVDEVYDSGRTVKFAIDYLKTKGATEVLTCLLARKPKALDLTPPDYLGFDLPDRFIVGYGLDDAGCKRGIPHICAVD